MQRMLETFIKMFWYFWCWEYRSFRRVYFRRTRWWTFRHGLAYAWSWCKPEWFTKHAKYMRDKQKEVKNATNN